MKRLCIIQPVMKAYRLPFFIRLAERLAVENIQLEVVYGSPWAQEALRQDHVSLPAPLGKMVQSRLLFGRLLLIPVWRSWWQADAVIVEHANKHVLNFVLNFFRMLGRVRLGYWGHGRDRQGDSGSLGERFKRRSLHWADWWFAYTQGAADYVRECGFAADRVTVVENAIDTSELCAELASISRTEIDSAFAGLGLARDGRCLVYCGSLYENKRLDLLMAAADHIHASQPEVQLIVIGGGPLAASVMAYAQSRPWVRYVGPTFGRDKAVLLRAAELWLNPGLVGLGILDAFCAGLPVLTTHVPVHSPEIEYLQHGENGLMVESNPAAFADAVLALLTDPERLAQLQAGARASAQRFSIETMTENFANGVVKWLRS